MKNSIRIFLSLALSSTLLMAVVWLAQAGAVPPAAKLTTGAEVDDQVTGSDRFIVQLAAPPVALYAGDRPGLAATMPALSGSRHLDSSAPAVAAYRAFLAIEQADVLEAISHTIGRAPTLHYRYELAFHGLALSLTPAEASRVASLPHVIQVLPETYMTLLTDAGPTFIGAPGLWDGSANDGVGSMGEGMLIGVLDTGIIQDHPSFAATSAADGYVHQNPLGSGVFLGDCVGDPSLCNDKLIGNYNYVDAPLAGNRLHGTNVSSIVAGNFVTTTITGPTLTMTRTLSGVAPHANLIMYDVCISNCPTTAIVAAIDQAVLDGVDVINFSIGSPSTDPWRDPTALAFLGARAAGVFVAAAAGNGGAPGTINSPADAPWLTSVGNVDHNRFYATSLIDMSGGATSPPADIKGMNIGAGYGPAPIVYAGDYGDAQCLTPFAPGTFLVGGTPAIVVCDRGFIGRTVKGVNVLAGDAGGLILANAAVNGEWLFPDAHVLPASLIGYAAGQTLISWLTSGSGHMAAITATEIDWDADNGDHVFNGSSRGENPAVPAVIKPDVVAPGFLIIGAGSSPLPGYSLDTSAYIGTSQASPHVAGAAALLLALQPAWTPAQVQSALMTTAVHASVTNDDWMTPATPFDRGAGRIDAGEAINAVLLLDETPSAFVPANPDLNGDPAQLNLASLGQGACVAGCQWTRTVTSAAAAKLEWTAVITAPAGVTVTVTPANFSLAPGASQTFTVTADVSGLAPTATDWLFGALIWTPSENGLPATHLPLAIRPAQSAVPDDIYIRARRDSGSERIANLLGTDITDLTFDLYGLTPATVTETFLSQDPTRNNPYDNLNDGTTLFLTMTVPVSSTGLLVEVLETTSPDLDLFVGLDTGDGLPAAGELVCVSATSGSGESCRLADPLPGLYWVVLQNYTQSAAPPDAVKLAVALIGGIDDGNLAIVAPTTVPDGEPFDLHLYWDMASPPGTVLAGRLDLGRQPDQPGDLGSTWIWWERLPDDVTRAASLATAPLGATVAFTLTVQPNSWRDEVTYSITDTLPAGLAYVNGSASLPPQISGTSLIWDLSLAPAGIGPTTITYAAQVSDVLCQQTAPSVLLSSDLVHMVDNPGAVPLNLAADITAVDLNLLCAPVISLSKTVGTDAGCAVADNITVTGPAAVTYCYSVMNTSPITVTQHSLFDDVEGDLIVDLNQTLVPGETFSWLHPAVLTETTVNEATWTVTAGSNGLTGAGADSATVTVWYYLYLPGVMRLPAGE